MVLSLQWESYIIKRCPLFVNVCYALSLSFFMRPFVHAQYSSSPHKGSIGSIKNGNFLLNTLMALCVSVLLVQYGRHDTDRKNPGEGDFR